MSWAIPYIPMPDYLDPGYDVPDNYVMRIFSSVYPKPLVGNIPASWQFALSATWDQPFSKSFADMASGNALVAGAGNLSGLSSLGKAFDNMGATKLAGNITGVSSLSKWLTMSVWMQGSGMSFSIPMTFRAFDDPVVDVNDKIVQLMMMCAPGSQTQAELLTAPGPTIAGLAQRAMGTNIGGAKLAGEIITVTLGNFITLPSVIITSVDVNCDNMCDIDGQPISATVNVSIETPMVMTKEDIKNMFNRSSFRQVNFDTLTGGFF